MKVVALKKYQEQSSKFGSPELNPPRPHAPSDRILIGKITGCALTPKFSTWEVRAFDRTGPFHLYFSTRDMLHLQLWNPYYCVSVLTPSKITGYHYEAFPIYDWKLASHSYAEIGKEIRNHFSTTLPTLSDVDAIASVYYAAGDLHTGQTQTSTSGAC